MSRSVRQLRAYRCIRRRVYARIRLGQGQTRFSEAFGKMQPITLGEIAPRELSLESLEKVRAHLEELLGRQTSLRRHPALTINGRGHQMIQRVLDHVGLANKSDRP